MSLKRFERFEEIAVSIALDNNLNLNELEKRGREFLAEYKSTGHIKIMPEDALTTNIYAFLPLLRNLLRSNEITKRVASPAERYKDSGWMAESSFCFVNVRALGAKPGTTGSFIDAMKILPSLRVTSIHLAPFFECSLQNAYAVDTVTVINEDVVNKDFLAHGFTAEDQLKLFTDVVHLLGMTVGFDLEPHTSQFSRIVIEHPEYFRWLKFKLPQAKLAWGMTQSEMLDAKTQAKIHDEVTALKIKVLAKYKLTHLEEKGRDPETKKAHLEIIREMIRAGLWTIPSHTWKGAGLPEYSHYVKQGGCEYPEFTYLSTDGENHREHAFGTLTPFKFYDGLPLNRVPSKSETPKVDESVVDYFTSIFTTLYDKYSFDYIRFDYVDHVFDSVTGKKKSPVSDRATPYVLEKTIATARKHGRGFIGAMAERMGTDIELYGEIGFDLLLGCDVLAPICNKLVIDNLQLNQSLAKLNAKRSRKVSVQFAVDSHDTGHPLFNVTPQLKYGSKGVALRMLLSRFCGAGLGIRPKYEVIGNQDGTTGLYRANINAVSLEWKSDKEMFGYYHNIENLFDELAPVIAKAKLGDFVEHDENTIFWYIYGKNVTIIPVVNTSTEKSVRNIAIQGLDPKAAGFVINPYDGTRLPLKKPSIAELKPLEARLIVIDDI